MRKVILLISVLVLAFSAFGVSAQTAPDMSTLAMEVPVDSYFYGAVRVDDAFIDGLDALLAPFYTYSEDLPEGFTLRDGINLALADSGMDITFEEDIRPWLGDSLALAGFVDPATFDETEFLSTDAAFDDTEVLVAVEIADRAGAEAFIEMALAAEETEFTALERGNYTYYDVMFGPVIAVDDDTMLIAEEFIMSEFNILSGDFASLGADTEFSTTLDRLPADGYSGLFYVHMPSVRSVVEIVAETSVDEFGKADANEALAVLDTFGIGSIASGFTGLDASTVAIDAVVLNGANYLRTTNLGSIDPAFAARIPGTTPFVVHGTNLKGLFDATVEALEGIAAESEDAEDVSEGLDEASAILQGETGLTLDDIIGWMVNDYALIARPSDTALGANSIFGLLGANPLGLGLLIDASEDPAAAVNVVNAIEEVLQGELVAAVTEGEAAAADVELTREDDIVTVSVTDNTGNVPFAIEVQVGVADDVFFIGTPDIANGILSGEGGLAATENFNEAAGVLLPQSVSVYYLDVDNLMPVVGIAENFAEEEDMEDIQTLRELLSLFSHATISQSIDANGNSFARATITLSN